MLIINNFLFLINFPTLKVGSNPNIVLDRNTYHGQIFLFNIKCNNHNNVSKEKEPH